MHSLHTWSCLVVATLVGLGTVGCVDNESSLFVRGVRIPDEGSCEVSNDPEGLMLAGGILDRAFPSERYEATLLVGNQLVPRGSADTIRTETARISLQGAEVRLTDTEGHELRKFSVDGTGFVDPSSGTNPGYGLLNVTLVPSLTNLETNILAKVKVYGRTLGGRELESGEYSFPIHICEGCLITYPAEANGADDGGYLCTRAGDGEVELPCRYGQDYAVDCRICAATVDLCLSPY